MSQDQEDQGETDTKDNSQMMTDVPRGGFVRATKVSSLSQGDSDINVL